MSSYVQCALVIALIVVASIMAITIFFYLFYRFCIRPDIDHIKSIENRIEPEDLFHIIDILLANEIIIYERYLTNTTDMEIGTALTNAQFINIYNDLSMRVLKAVTPTFYALCEVYLSKKEIQTYLTQRVYSYLAEKVSNNAPMDEEEDESYEE